MPELNPKEVNPKQQNQENKTSETAVGGQSAQGSQPQGKSESDAQAGSASGGTSDLAQRRTRPSTLMRLWADEMDRVFDIFGFGRSYFGFPSLFEGLSSTPGSSALSQTSTWVPQVEVLDKEGRLIVRADVPGLKKEDLKVELTEDALIIQGERKHEREDKGEGFYRSERSYGSFYRAIPPAGRHQCRRGYGQLQRWGAGGGAQPPHARKNPPNRSRCDKVSLRGKAVPPA
jgi:HSP20 family protein